MHEELTFRRFPVTTGISLAYLLEDTDSYHGIYILHFADGKEYVGQAVDFLSRYRVHSRRYGSRITAIDFAPVIRPGLDQFEILTIHWRQREGADLLNILLKNTLADYRLPDHWMPQQYPITFRLLPHQIPDQKLRGQDASADLQGLKNYVRLIEHPRSTEAIEALAVFLGSTIRDPAKTEGSNWVVTAVPRSDDGRRRLACLTFQNMHLLTLFDSGRGEIYATANIVPSPVLSTRYKGEDQWHEADHVMLREVRLQPRLLIQALKEDPCFVTAARNAVSLWASRGASVINRQHCWPLADALLAHIYRSAEKVDRRV
ncbi:hypothetical protein ACFVYC_20205 [Pseudarthrobacter sp. NPDC058329]|uniref:hypothetical protein n=1 Tax=Pseudarthrobacter sp. NPDC058329 TaxID=3346448 RepID=UPI0036DCFD93